MQCKDLKNSFEYFINCKLCRYVCYVIDYPVYNLHFVIIISIKLSAFKTKNFYTTTFIVALVNHCLKIVVALYFGGFPSQAAYISSNLFEPHIPVDY